MTHMSTATQGQVPALTLGWRLKMSLGDMAVGDMAVALGVSRATMSRWMADRGSPPKRAYLCAVQELLGHLRPETTAGYVRTPDEAIRAAVEAAAA